VVIEGSPDEVASILAKLGTSHGKDVRAGEETRATTKLGKVAQLVGQLADEGYFKSKRGLADIQKKLEEGGHIFPITTISPCLTRMTKKRLLRRLKEGNLWVYVT
jgi:hypothetical protein